MGKKVKTYDDLIENRVPETDDKHVGIEIEFISPYQEDELAKRLLMSALSDYVTLKDDSSIDANNDESCECCCRDCHDEEPCGADLSDHRYGHELCVLAKQSELGRVMRMVGAFLRKAKAEVNKTCGLHVHLDMRSRDKEKAFTNLVYIQEVLYRMCDPDRRNSSYCQPIETTDLNYAKDCGRYRSINASALHEHNTLEVRLHHGTVSVSDITCWVKMLCHTVDANRLPKAIKTPKAAARQLGVDSVIAKYMERKAREWRAS